MRTIANKPTEAEILGARQILASSHDIVAICAALDILQRAGLRHKEPRQNPAVKISQEQLDRGGIGAYLVERERRETLHISPAVIKRIHQERQERLGRMAGRE